MIYRIRLVSLDLDVVKPSIAHATSTGRWYDSCDGIVWYDGETPKDCARVAIEHAEKAILELKEHIKQLKKIK